MITGVAGDNSEWVSLSLYDTITNCANNERKYDKGNQHIWHMTNGYFIKKNELDSKFKRLNIKNSFRRQFPEANRFYQLFSREFIWSDSYKRISHDSCPSVDKTIDEKNKKKEMMREILPAYMEYMWEKGYDASQTDTTSFQIPCKEIIEFFSLEQREYDGFFYDEKDTLVAFDGRLNQCSSGLMIRKDFLNRFLHENGYALFWICLGEKQFFNGSPGEQRYSEWGGIFQYHDDQITGEISNREGKPILTQ